MEFLNQDYNKFKIGRKKQMSFKEQLPSMDCYKKINNQFKIDLINKLKIIKN